jgi:hypothetical protein
MGLGRVRVVPENMVLPTLCIMNHAPRQGNKNPPPAARLA